MPLAQGTRLGPYAVVSPLGAGGMGEVYRARDTKLNRDMALKILPEAFAADPDHLMRFTREAQTLASLNHPNIAAIYGLEHNALVMELVEGEDLSARISRGAMPIEDVPQLTAFDSPLAVLGRRRFLVGLREEAPATPAPNVILNWAPLAPAGR
jgi:serine/threonine protein kinase